MSCTCDHEHKGLVTADVLQQHMHPYLPALGEAGRRYHMMRAAAEFMEQSNAFEGVFYLDAQSMVDMYEVCTRDGLMPLKVRQVQIGGHRLNKRTHDYADDCYHDHHAHDTYFFEPDGTLYITPAPGCDGRSNIEVRATVGLTLDACAVPKVVADRYIKTIVSGALASAYLLDDTEFFDTRKAGVHESRFRRGIASAKGTKLGDFSTGPTYMKPARWV